MAENNINLFDEEISNSQLISISEEAESKYIAECDCRDWEDADFHKVCLAEEVPEASKTKEIFNIDDVDWSEEFPYNPTATVTEVKNCFDNLKTAYSKVILSSKMAERKYKEMKEFAGEELPVEITKINLFKTASNKILTTSESARVKAEKFINECNK